MVGAALEVTRAANLRLHAAVSGSGSHGATR